MKLKYNRLEIQFAHMQSNTKKNWLCVILKWRQYKLLHNVSKYVYYFLSECEQIKRFMDLETEVWIEKFSYNYIIYKCEISWPLWWSNSNIELKH